MKAFLSNYRQTPRKVRLVTDLVKGRSVPDALSRLSVLPKRASLPVKKLIMSAAKNAETNSKIAIEDLVISKIEVNAGMVLKRSMPRARGSASRLKRRTSHVEIVLTKRNTSDGKKKDKK